MHIRRISCYHWKTVLKGVEITMNIMKTEQTGIQVEDILIANQLLKDVVAHTLYKKMNDYQKNTIVMSM